MIEIIKSAPIDPTPTCTNLFYTFDWKSFIMGKFARTPLEHHSFYHSFAFTKEASKVKFRCKRYPQDQEYIPFNGIQLLIDEFEFSPVGPADFRIEKLELDKVFRSLHSYLATLELKDRIKVSASWDALRKTLDSLPRRKDNLLKMKVAELPSQPLFEDQPVVPEHLSQCCSDNDVPEIRGEFYCDTAATDTEFSDTVPINTDVVVYTRSKVSRPWVGRIMKHLPGGMFTLQWYKRRGRSTYFDVMVNFDGSPVLSDQANEVVMYWHIANRETLTDSSFQIPLLWLEKLKQDYLDHDSAYE